MGDRPAAVLRHLQARRPERLPRPVHQGLRRYRQAVEVHQRPGRRRARHPGRVLGADLGQGAGQAGATSRPPWPRPPRWATTCGTRCSTSTSRRSATASAPAPAPPAPARTRAHYLLSWYYAWGGATDASAGWSWRIGSSHNHFGYQNPLAAWALSQRRPSCKPQVADRRSRTGPTSLDRQLEFYQLAAVRRGRHRRWRHQQLGRQLRARRRPARHLLRHVLRRRARSTTTRRRTSGSASRPGRWSASPSTTTQTGNAKAKALLDKWVAWAIANTTINAARQLLGSRPTLQWTGQPGHLEPDAARRPTPACTSTVTDYRPGRRRRRPPTPGR